MNRKNNMKKILEFNDPEDNDIFEIHMKAIDMSIAIDEIYDKLFRPMFKHGYADEEMRKLVEKNPKYAHKLIEALSKMYWQILQEQNLK